MTTMLPILENPMRNGEATCPDGAIRGAALRRVCHLVA